MSRRFLVALAACCLASCATGEDDTGSLKFDGGVPADASVDATGEAGGPEAGVDGATPDTTVPDAGPPTDSTAADTATVPDTYVADTFVADTYVADTFVADTYVADTFVADTYVADTAPVDAGGCSGTIVDWNWNTGTAPTTTLTTSGKTWKVGTATSGPSDSQTYLATIASGSLYPNLANDWVRLPTLDLSAYKTCKIKVSVSLWRNAEKYGLVNYDGGNLQYTTDPAAASGWTLMDGGSMGYDGNLQCTSCLMAGQKTWTSSSTPFTKTGTFTSAAALGSSMTMRFTFYSDDAGQLPGIFVKSVRVEAVP